MSDKDLHQPIDNHKDTNMLDPDPGQRTEKMEIEKEPLLKDEGSSPIQAVRGKDLVNARKKNLTRKQWKLVFFSFLLPMLAYLPAFFFSGIFPFGGNTTMAVDLRHEYVGFYEAFRHALSHPEGFFYNLTKSLGGEMVGTFSYYMMSPFNLLFFLFPRESLPYIIQATQVLKIGLAGAFFSILLIKNEHGHDWRVVLFSTMYGLLAFSTANLLNHMWLDPILIFPLVILGLEKMMRGGKARLYVISLSLMIWTNFYIAYMGCIFIVLYYIYSLVRRGKPSGMTRGDYLKKEGKNLGRFAFFSLLAGAICAVLLIPTLYAMFMSKVSYANEVVANWEFDYPPIDFVAKLLPGAFNYKQVPSGLPNVFTGSLTLIFLLLYLMNGRIKIRERLISLVILTFLILSMNIDKLNVFWHGMQYPIWYEYRFSWVFSFFTALLAFRSMMRFRRAQLIKIILITTLYALLIAFLYQNMDRYPFILIYHIIFAPIIFLVFILALLLYRRHRKAARIILTIMVFVEMSLDATVHTVVYNYESLEEFQFFEKIMQEATKDILPDGDDELWRLEKTFMHDNNDGMRFVYPTISHFNSSLERKPIDLFGSLGFPVSKNMLSGTNPTKFTDAFFNIRYLLEGRSESFEEKIKGIDKLKPKSMRPDLADYKKLGETGYINIYENTDALPMGILAEEGIIDLHANRANPLDFQERIINLIDRKPNQVNYFVRSAVTEKEMENLKITKEAKYTTSYERVDEEKPAYIDYSFTPVQGYSSYLTVSNTLNKLNAKLYLGGEEVVNKRMGKHASSQVYNVGSQNGGKPLPQVLRVSMEEGKNKFDINNISLFYFDHSLFKSVVDFQQKNGLTLTKRTDTRLEGSFQADEKTPYMVFSLPYDKGWTAEIDGKQVEPVEVLDALLAIPVEAGSHDLVLHYELPYFRPASYISLGAVAVYLLIELAGLLGRRRRRKAER